MARTVRVIVAGGLGNQMFMYAAARALAVRTKASLILDPSAFRRDTVYKRVFLLDRFPIVGAVAPQGWLSSIRSLAERITRKFPRLASRLGLFDEPTAHGMQVFDPRLVAPPALRAFSLRGYWQSEAYFRDVAPMIRSELVAPPALRAFSLRGYWQSEAYFRDVAPMIRSELSPPPPTGGAALGDLHRIQASRHPVAVGVRFFGEAPGGGTDPSTPLAAFREQVTAHAAREPGCDYFVFTDEPGHLRDPDCLGVPFTLITPRPRNEDAPVDLFLMTQCQTFFIGYSSFHWWGAWLAASPQKQVTYLHFPGRPCDGYAAEGWRVGTAGA